MDELEKDLEKQENGVTMVDERTIIKISNEKDNINVTTIPAAIVKGINDLTERLSRIPSASDIGKVIVASIKFPAFPESMKIFGKVGVDFPDTQKVEVVNKTKVQEITGEVTNKELLKSVDALSKQLALLRPKKTQKVSLEETISTKVEGLPVSEGQEVHKEKANPSKYINVRYTDGKKFVGMPGTAMAAGSSPLMDKVWLREEFTVTDGNTTRITRWDGQFKMVEDIAYDGSGNATAKTRSIEPEGTIGA